MLTARKQHEKKMLDTELGFRGVLRGFGLRIGKTSRGRFARRVQALAHGNPGAWAGDSGNAARTRRCKRRWTTLTFMSVVDDPGHFRSTKTGRSAFWPDAEEAPIRRDGHHRRTHQGRRRKGMLDALRGGARRGACELHSGEGETGRSSPGRGSWPPFSIACGSTARHSASARRSSGPPEPIVKGSSRHWATGAGRKPVG